MGGTERKSGGNLISGCPFLRPRRFLVSAGQSSGQQEERRLKGCLISGSLTQCFFFSLHKCLCVCVCAGLTPQDRHEAVEERQEVLPVVHNKQDKHVYFKRETQREEGERFFKWSGFHKNSESGRPHPSCISYHILIITHIRRANATRLHFPTKIKALEGG